MTIKRVFIYSIATALVVSSMITIKVVVDLRYDMNAQDIKVASPGDWALDTLRVAIIGDLHVGSGVVDMPMVRQLFAEVEAQSPDAIFILGDYIGDQKTRVDMIRPELAKLFGGVADNFPTFLILGNHDTWTNAETWLEVFRREGLTVLENQVVETEIGNVPACVRGLGDYYTNRFQEKDWPLGCEEGVRITLTHDPAAVFQHNLKGLVFSGHTHCGQVVVPLVGAPWAPTTAPTDAQCGLFENEEVSLFVTSGIGTSIVPFRFFAPSQWDLVTLRFH